MHLGGVPLIIHFPGPWGLRCSTCSKNYYHLHSAHLRTGLSAAEVTQFGPNSQRVLLRALWLLYYILHINQVDQSKASFFFLLGQCKLQSLPHWLTLLQILCPLISLFSDQRTIKVRGKKIHEQLFIWTKDYHKTFITYFTIYSILITQIINK